MPSPAWHYDEAERLLTKAAECVVSSIKRELVAAAQAHATLATVIPYALNGYDDEEGVLVDHFAPTVVDAKLTGDQL